MNTPLISIIIPVYNVELYLEACISSIVNQSLSNIEIILVDDGSTDNSGLICDEWKNRDNRISVIHQPNAGLSAARNIGTSFANSNLIMYIDSDDLLHKEACKIVYNLLTSTKADMVVFGYDMFLNNIPDLTKIINLNNYVELSASEALFEMFLPYSSFNITAWNKLYYKRYNLSHTFPHNIIHEDFFVIPFIVSELSRIIYLKESLYYVRKTPGSITRKTYSLKRLDELAGVETTYNLLKSKQEYSEALNLFYRIYLWKLCDHMMYLDKYFKDRKDLWNTVYNKFREIYKESRNIAKISIKDKFSFDMSLLLPKYYNRIRYKFKSDRI